MENILFGEIFGKLKVLNITYIFMKGRALKQKNETIIPNDFFYFYKKIVTLAQHSLNRNGCLYLEINPKFKENLLGFIKSNKFFNF